MIIKGAHTTKKYDILKTGKAMDTHGTPSFEHGLFHEGINLYRSTSQDETQC